MQTIPQMPDDERVLLARERTYLANERNRLANSRTFSSWIRTGLASVGGGLALMKLLTFHYYSHLLMANIAGSILIILGVLIFLLSYLDYRKSYKKLLIQNGFAGSIWFVSLLSFSLIVVSVVLLIIALRMPN